VHPCTARTSELVQRFLSRDVSVTRTLFDRHVPVYCAYTLSGARGIEDLRSVEGRLRSLILAEITGAQVMLTRLV
jgi:hypothetical protein